MAYGVFNLKLIPDMSRNAVRRVGDVLKRLREEERVAWHDIVEEGGGEEGVASWDDPEAFVRGVSLGYRRDRWTTQPVWLLVVSEKGTVRGIIRPVTDQYGVGFMAVGGFASATRMHDLAERSNADDRPLVVAYVGDHDPSGRYMSDVDLPGRVAEYGGDVEVRRLALVSEDVLRGDVSTFGVESKRKDPRYRWFKARFGGTCAEVDALDPRILRQRVEDAICEYIDWPAWARCDAAERAETESLREVMLGWAVAVKQQAEAVDDPDDQEQDEQMRIGTDLPVAVPAAPLPRFRRPRRRVPAGREWADTFD